MSGLPLIAQASFGKQRNNDLPARIRDRAVLASPDDLNALRRVLLNREFNSIFVSDFQQARAAVQTWSSVDVLICSTRLSDGTSWKDVLDEIQAVPVPPQFIVADRLADERLWAEVLNLGGHDLLATPFDCMEVLYAVGMACRHRENQQQMTTLRQLKRECSAADISRSAEKCSAAGVSSG